MPTAPDTAHEPSRQKARRRAIVLGVTALYLALSLLIFAKASPEERFQTDSWGYLTAAQQFGEHTSEAYALRMPGYPLFLKLFLDAENRLASGLVLAVQTLLALLTALLAQRLYAEITGKPGVAVYALTLLNPGALFFPQLLLTEVPFAFLLALHSLFVLRCLRGAGLGQLAGAALSGFLLYLVKPQGLGVYALSLCVAACATLARRGWREGLRLCLLGAGLFLLPVLGFLWVKHAATGDWTLVPTSYSTMITSELLTGIESKLASYPLPDQNELRRRGREHARQELGIAADRWRQYSELEQQRLVADNIARLVAGYGVKPLAKGLLSSVYAFFVDDPGGMVLALGLPNASLRDFAQGLARGEPRAAGQAQAVAIKAGVYLFSCAKMLLVALAVLVMLKALPAAESLLLAAQILLALASCNVMAYSRFRFPVDPLLHVLIAVHALPAARRALQSLRRK